MLLNLFAQVEPVPVPVKEWLVALIIAVTPVVVSVLAYVVNLFKSKMPSWLKPLLATGLGALAAYLGTVVSDNPLLMAAIGLAAIGLREIVNQLTKALGLTQKS